MLKKRYRLIDHTADFGIHVFGADSKDLFVNAGLAMFDIITEIETLKSLDNHRLIITGADWSDLMVNWLRELLYLWACRNMLVKSIDILSISERHLDAAIIFDLYDPNHHEIENEIKAVTYHQIQVCSGPSGWEAKIIFDV